MSHKQKKSRWPIFAAIGLAIAAIALVRAATRANSNASVVSTRTIESRKTPTTRSRNASAHSAGTRGPTPRNLSLQPEAFNMSRRLGARFSPTKRQKSILVGTLTIGSERRVVHTTRTQTEKGEQVEIMIAGSPGALTWDAQQGALSSSRRATGGDLELIERLVLDSPDQFVLAQLRGASYYTVARNVRPSDAGDDYNGPLWNIVRVDDPEADEAKRPQSRWRLYYLNTLTGLIDRIESEIQGERIVAEISGWTEHNGEKVPAEITWKRQSQTLLQYSLTHFSHAEE